MFFTEARRPTLKSYVRHPYRNIVQRGSERDPDVRGARALGWASIALGVASLAGTRAVQKLMGLEDQQSGGVIRAVGMREIGHGIDILAHKDPTPGVWSRVAGDSLDGVLLGVGAAKTRKPGSYAAVAAAVLGIAALDLLFATRLSSDD
ncbi:MAG TPA: hypothetical protein VER17_01155 [Tepidisphaeraceae bacterium]|nr:hypothetical protein [Tepidisphaeraceae bacterium]